MRELRFKALAGCAGSILTLGSHEKVGLGCATIVAFRSAKGEAVDMLFLILEAEPSSTSWCRSARSV